MTNFNYKTHLQTCLTIAKEASAQGEIPVGAVIVDVDNNVVSMAHNMVEEDNNPLKHAEVIAINEACFTLGRKFLHDCCLYVNLEPCCYCCSAILLARIPKLVFAASDKKSGCVINNKQMFENRLPYPKVEVYEDLYGKETENMLRDFFDQRRKKRTNL